jgi:hypothetical protein
MKRLMPCAVAIIASTGLAGAEPFADRVVAHVVGSGGGAGEGLLPGVVLGPPHGGGEGRGVPPEHGAPAARPPGRRRRRRAVRRDRVHGGRMRGADNEGEGDLQVIVPGVRA